MIPATATKENTTVSQAITSCADKLNKKELKIEDILKEEDVVNDMKKNNFSQFFSIFSDEIIRTLIDYSTKLPKSDDLDVGYKFPLFSCEILSSDSDTVSNLFLKISENPGDEKNKEENAALSNSKGGEDNKDQTNKKSGDVSKEKNEITYNNLDYFLEFLKMPPENSNYVLIGYFNKILCNLIDKKGEIIINYLFENRTDYLDHLIKNLNRRVIGECICLILTYSNDTNITLLNKNKIQLVEKIIKELIQTKDEDSFEFICSLLITSIANKQFFILLMLNYQLINLLFFVLFKEPKNERNLQCLLSLMIKINETILRSFNGIVTPERTEVVLDQVNGINLYGLLNYDDDKKLMLGDTEEDNLKNLQSTLKKLFNSLKANSFLFFADLNKFDKQDLEVTTYDGKQKALGLYKLSQIEYFKTILDILINANAKEYYIPDIDSLLKMVINLPIFKNLIYIFFKFEFNNLFQSLFAQIMQIVLNEHCPNALIDHLFSKEKLTEKIRDDIINTRVFIFGSKRTMIPCLFAFEISILHEVFESSNKHLKEVLKSNLDFQKFNEIFIIDINSMFKAKLCYSEEGNALLSFQINNNSTVNVAKETVEKESLMETIQSNMKIYDVYKKGGYYEKLMKEKYEKRGLECPNEYININSNGVKKENINQDNVLDKKQSNYSDNNFWDLNEEDNKFINVQLLNDFTY